MNKEKGYSVWDIIDYSTSTMDNLHVSDTDDVFFWRRFMEANAEFYWILSNEEKRRKYDSMRDTSKYKIEKLSDKNYLDFLKECDIYIYMTLYNEPNAYGFPEDTATDNYYWVSRYYDFRENTEEQLDFAIEKITACLEWSKKKDKETNWGMLEWVEKNQAHLDTLLEKRKNLES